MMRRCRRLLSFLRRVIVLRCLINNRFMSCWGNSGHGLVAAEDHGFHASKETWLLRHCRMFTARLAGIHRMRDLGISSSAVRFTAGGRFLGSAKNLACQRTYQAATDCWQRGES